MGVCSQKLNGSRSKAMVKTDEIITKKYRRSRKTWKGQKGAWTNVKNNAGVTDEMLAGTEHTETQWVFVVERLPTHARPTNW